MTLDAGFYDVPAGHVATIVTHLEMREKPASRPDFATGLSLKAMPNPEADWYRSLFRRVGGEDWLWFSRLALPQVELHRVITAPQTRIWAAQQDGQDVGLLELDFSDPQACELAFFGLAPETIGTGAGRWLMNQALDLAWSEPISRLHLHTCTLDHPAALDFYRRSGFVATKRQVEIAPDPRLNDILPEQAAPHIPILR